MTFSILFLIRKSFNHLGCLYCGYTGLDFGEGSPKNLSIKVLLHHVGFTKHTIRKYPSTNKHYLITTYYISRLYCGYKGIYVFKYIHSIQMIRTTNIPRYLLISNWSLQYVLAKIKQYSMLCFVWLNLIVCWPTYLNEICVEDCSRKKVT